MAFVVSAVSTAIAVGSVAAVATAVAEVGIAMTVVGKVAGVKELTKVGQVLSVAGGVTSLAANATSFFADAATNAVGDTASSAAGDAIKNVGSQAADTGAQTFGVDVPKVSDFASTTNQAVSSGSTGGVLNGSGGLSDAASTAGTNELSSMPQASGELSSTPQASTAPGATNLGSSAISIGGTIAPPADTSSGGIQKWWSGLDSRTKMQVLQTGAGVASGLFNGWSAEQRNALERDKLNLQQNQYNKQVSNAAYVPSITYARPQTGMINTVTQNMNQGGA